VRRPMVVVAVITAAVIGLLLSGCGEKQAQQQAAPASQAQSAPQSAQTKSQAQPAPQTAQAYPIDWCIVSGEKLGEMGPPVEYDYNGRQIKFCCGGCVKKFEADPAMYIAKLDSAAAAMKPSM
jgi:YHS domain-containing protein